MQSATSAPRSAVSSDPQPADPRSAAPQPADLQSAAPQPADAEPNAITSFSQLDLSKVMLRALVKNKYETPSPIQAQVIPPALEGNDIIGQARTGTGKTAAFSIPILEMLDPVSECPNPQALILVPTRELAEQVAQEIERLAYGCKTSVTVLAGGKHMRKQMQQLSDGTQIVVGTPGRVQDHILRRTFKTEDLWCVVLDEADRMLDIGFRPAIEKILRSCPKDRQTMLLSATLPPEIQRLTERFLVTPVHVNCSSKQVSVETIEQRYFSIQQNQKFDLLLKLLEREQPKQAIIFCRTKRGTDRLQRDLSKAVKHIDALANAKIDCIHGDMNQRDRDRVFGELRAGKIEILVATDVVGRGIDVSTVSHIINFDMPLDCDDYVHRVGRTGRMGREGIAFTFVTLDEGPQLTAIELNINRLLTRDSMSAEPQKSPRLVTAEAEAAAELAQAAEFDPAAPRKKRLFPMKRKANGRLARVGARR